MNGYNSDDEIPIYREVQGTIKAMNPYHGWIPVIIQDEKTAMHLRKRRINQSIGELLSLVSNQKSEVPLIIHYPPKIENMLMRDGPFQPCLHVGSNSVYGIIECVKNIVLDWSLKLEEEGILGDGMSFSREEKVKAQSGHISINNFQGVLGNVTESTVTQNLEMTVTEGDFESLSKFLKSKDIIDDDIKELSAAIDADSKPTEKNKLGNKVSEWIGKMITKAASGVWKIGAGAAGTLLTKAILTYYGLE